MLYPEASFSYNINNNKKITLKRIVDKSYRVLMTYVYTRTMTTEKMTK